MVDFTQERAEEGGGVTRRLFSVSVNGQDVPAALWAPEGARGPRPLVLMGHGGSQHKKTAGIVARAKQYARRLGYATLAIDAPGHGDRITREEAEAMAVEVGARVTGQTTAAPDDPRMAARFARMREGVAEWKAALDAVQTLDFVGAGGPVGYWGVSMGTAIGVPFVAVEPRITCAVFGLAGLREGMAEAAAKITCPVEFVFQWEDAVAPREAGLGLFNAFASTEKTMHINPGGHMGIPDFEGASWERFYVRHLGVAADAKARVAEPA